MNETSSMRVPLECESDFLVWLREYATMRARLIDEGQIMAMTVLDREHWFDANSGARNFHFGGMQ